MVDREVVERWWEEYVGSRHQSWKDELRVLNVARKERTVPFNRLAAMYVTTKYWAYIRGVVLRRDRFKCVVCGSSVDLHVDHVRYGKVFGGEKLENLQTLCRLCHVGKTKKFDLSSSAKESSIRLTGSENLYEMMLKRKHE